MNKDAWLIFENYAKTLSVAVAKSSAGLPIGKKPFDEDAEISPKKLVKKIANLPLLNNDFQEDIRFFLETEIDDLITMGFDPEQNRDDAIGIELRNVAWPGAGVPGGPAPGQPGPGVDPDNPDAPGPDDYIHVNRAKWSGTHPGGSETLAPGVEDLVNRFAENLSQKVAKEFIKKRAYEDAAKYRRDNVDRNGTTNPENFDFLPGGDVYVKDHIMKQAVPKALAPKKPPGRTVDYMWKEIADYDPKKVYWNSLKSDGQDTATIRMNEIFKDLFGEGYNFHHLIDVLLSGFEDPLKIMESLIKNPNIEKIRDVYARFDKWLMEQKKGRLKRGNEEGQDYVTVKSYPNRFTWRQMISRAGCEREGAIQDHCVGQYDPTNPNSRIFTLVDNKGDSHVTIQVGRRGDDEDDIEQIRGKKNSRPKQEYVPYIEDFIANKEGLPDAKFGGAQGIPDAGRISSPGPIIVTVDGEMIGWKYHDEHNAYYSKEQFPTFSKFFQKEQGHDEPEGV